MADNNQAVITAGQEDKEAMAQQMLEQMGLDARGLDEDFVRYLYRMLGRSLNSSSYYHYKALSHAVRERLMTLWKQTWKQYNEDDSR
ncbi:MAG: hypothetical protein ACPGYX_01730, partial [Oceanobacter sp.]